MVRDIALNEDGDLAVSPEGDLALEVSDGTHIAHVLEAHPGHYKQHPMIGMGLIRYVHAPIDALRLRAMRREIEIQLSLDGAVNSDVQIDQNAQLTIHAEYF